MNNQEEFYFFVFNIRLLTDHQRSPHTYKALFLEMFWKDSATAMDKRTSLVIKSMEEDHLAGVPVLKGYLSQFTDIDETQWLSAWGKEVEEPAMPDDIFPISKDFEYVFIPHLHRFCLIARRGDISLSRVQTLLETGLNKIARQNEEVHVTLEKSGDFLHEIMASSRILDIKFSISCSNQDLNDEYSNLVDNQLRDAEIEYLEISGRARDGKSVNLKKSQFLMGAAGLVPCNGKASAQIVTERGEKKTIDTSDYPRIFRIPYGERDKLEEVVLHMRAIYRRGDEG